MRSTNLGIIKRNKKKDYNRFWRWAPVVQKKPKNQKALKKTLKPKGLEENIIT